MPTTDKFFAINIRKYLALGDDDEAGEPALVKLLSGFSCPKNPDVERFLKKSAVEFTKKNQSVTYLVFSKDNGEMLGYFTLALKPLTIRGETVSNTTKRKLLRVSELAWIMIEKTQYMFGGMVTFLEAENEEKLLSFYRNNRFSQFDTRQTAAGKDEPHELVQLLRLL